ncbi:MAG: acyl-CoA thioesterase, partial [Mogibacterium sp.]|nr:acyl-CoA thioesterase [Mogibacterium sp.]
VSPMLAVSCKYMHPVRYGDTIRIAVRMVRLTRLKCAFTYEITDAATGEIRAKGTSEHGFLTRSGRPVILPKDRPEFYAMCQAEYEPEEQ